MMKGFKKRLIVLSVCLTTLYLLPTDTYAQDGPNYDPGQIEQPADQSQQQPADQQAEGAFEERGYKDDAIFKKDSVGEFNTSGLDFNFKHKGGGGAYSLSGGGPLDPPPDPDAPIDNGLLVLLAFGIAYGARKIYLHRRATLFQI